MATAGQVKQVSPSKNDAFVESQLDRARRRIRFLDVTTALLGLFAGTLAFGLGMAILDSLLELPTATRGLAFALYLGAAGCYLALTVIRPLMRRINPYYAARKVEETLPGAKNSVVNWLDLRDDEKLPLPIHHAVSQRAARDLSKADIDQAVSGKRAGWAAGVAGLLFVVLLVLLFSFGARKFMSHLGRAFLPFSAGGPATRTLITLIEPENGNITLSADQPFKVNVEIGGRIPETVKLVTRPSTDDPETERLFEEDDRDRKNWTAFVSGPDVKTGFLYRVVAGDAQTEEYRVTVRSSPLIDMDRFVATFHPRAYVGQTVDRIQRAKRDLSDLRGTKVSLDVWTNRTLREGWLNIHGEGKSARINAQLDPKNPQRMQFDFVLEQTSTYDISFKSADGERYSDPQPQPITVRPDKAPEVELTKPGLDVALSVNDPLELEGKATDDIGVKEILLQMRVVNGAMLRAKPYRPDADIKLADGGYPLVLEYKDFVDLSQVKDTQGRPFGLTVGMVLEYWLQAKDACDFPEPNTGESKHYKVTITDVKKDEKKKEAQNQKAEQRKQEHQKQQDEQIKKENQERQQKANQQKEQQEKDRKEQEEKRQREQNQQNQDGKPDEKPKPEQGQNGEKEKKDPAQQQRDKEAERAAEKAAEAARKEEQQERDKKKGEGKDDKQKRGAGKDDPDKNQDKNEKGEKDKNKGQNGEAKGNPDKSNDPGKDGGKEAGPQGDKHGEGKKDDKGDNKQGEAKDGQNQPGGEQKAAGKDDVQQKNQPQQGEGQAKPADKKDGNQGEAKQPDKASPEKQGQGKNEGQPMAGGQEKAQPKDGPQQGDQSQGQGKEGAKPQPEKGQRGEGKKGDPKGGEEAGADKGSDDMQGDKKEAGKPKDGGMQGDDKSAGQGKGEEKQQPRGEGKEGGKDMGQQSAGKGGPKEGDPMMGKAGSEKDGAKDGDQKSASAKEDRLKGDPKQRGEQKPATEARKEDVEKTAEDLKSDDAKDREDARRRLEDISRSSADGDAREAAEKKLEEERQGKNAASAKKQPGDKKQEGESAQSKGGEGGGEGDDNKQASGKEGGKETGQAQGKGGDDKKNPDKKGSEGSAKGNGETDPRRVKEELDKLSKAVAGKKNEDGEKQKQADKEIKELFDEVMKDLKSDDLARREKARKFLEEVQKQMKDKDFEKQLPGDKFKEAQEEAKKNGGGGVTGTGATDAQGNSPELKPRDNPAGNGHRDKAGDLTIARFDELVKKPKFIEDTGLSPEQIKNVRRWLKEKEKQKDAAVATDKGKPLSTTGVDLLKTPDGKVKGVEGSNEGLPPLEFRDGFKEFQKKLQEAQSGAGAKDK